VTKKDTVIGAKYDVMLWSFKCKLEDRRTGKDTDGYIVVTGNADCDLDEAQREIQERYGNLGYTVTECIYDDMRMWQFDALKIFKAARCNRCAGCEDYIKADSITGRPDRCRILAEQQKEREVDDNLITSWSNYGYNCAYYEQKEGSKKTTEDEPDHLTEIMATLAELKEREG
jgi:hypothetical protein